ncbi:DUF6924 domain-containing protein [Streptomyces griseoaurantiacus]|uniref:DUF6924 domain-containing protein n=1 Tax=Streptomyces griseoaurantiacus TaxID=68213 RepID=UPI002ED4D9FD|nr:hypothetical protein OHA67_32380 [Streptomyces jietaisiensis]
MLLLDTGDDEDAWEDVLWRMGELPGVQDPSPGPAADAGRGTAVPRRLLVAHDTAWRGATAEEAAAAPDRPGVWVPDLVVLTDERTERHPDIRPLPAFRGGDAFWITPRQAAMTYLVPHRPHLGFAFDDFATWGPLDLDRESVDEGDEERYGPVGAEPEKRDAPPRYTRPARELPALLQDTDLLVRTDFGDDAAWAALVEPVHRPPHSDVIDDFGPYLRFVDDPAFAGATPEQVMTQLRFGDGEDVSDVLLIADAVTLSAPGKPMLAVPLTEDIGLTFLVEPEEVGTMIANLGVGNQGLEDWRDRTVRGGA